MRADNDGEGGILVLMSLIKRSKTERIEFCYFNTWIIGDFSFIR